MTITRHTLAIIAVCAATFGIYAVNFENPLFWDDTDWIVNNPFVHKVSWGNIVNWLTKNTLAGIGLQSNYYRPFLFFTFTVNHILHGTWPIGYHLVNNLLHIANGVLIYAMLWAAFRNRFIALFVSAFFLVHPLQTEAVTYIAGRGDPLNVFFMLLALFVIRQADARGESWRQWRRPVSMVLVMLAVASRETAIIFPFLLMVERLAFRSRGKFLPAIATVIKGALPYAAFIFGYGILRLTVLNFENTLNFYATANPYTESIFVRMYTFMGILLTYARLLVAPLGLHMERSAVVYGSPWFWQVLVPVAILAGVAVIGIRWYRRQRGLGEGVNGFRVLLFSVGWFFVNLGPTSGITPINALLYEHWLYLAMVGPITLVLFFLHHMWVGNRSPFIRIGIPVFLIGVLAWFSVLTVQRNRAWGDPIAFFQDILRYEPESVRINNNLGNLYYDAGDAVRAEEYYWRAVRIEDAFPQPHFNLGTILETRGDVRGALVEFEKAIELDQNFPYAYQHLAVIYANQGNLTGATDALEKLTVLTPNDPRVFYNLAQVLLVRRDPQSAIRNLRQGLTVSEDDPEVRASILELLRRLER